MRAGIFIRQEGEHQTKPSFGWVRRGSNPAIKTTAGRGRVNIHGALCLENFDAPFVEPVTVDGNSAVQLLAKIQANNPTKSIIHVIWDKAAYHRCNAVKKWLARPGCRIHLIQLPPYCPHLNPALRHVNMPCRAAIERLWALMHANVTRNRFYPTQKQFAEAILRFFRQTIPKNWVDFEVKSQIISASSHIRTFGFWGERGITDDIIIQYLELHSAK